MNVQSDLGRRHKFLLIALLLGSLLGLLAGEGLIRVLSNTDADGNLWLFGKILGPTQPRLGRLASLVEKLETEGEKALYVYDGALGWKFRPGATSEHGLYHIDERGIRTGARAAPRREDPIIALYGDSFTFCSDVRYEESWGYQFEELLADAGAGYQVLNLGVGGYGMGQAYLRWRSTHSELRPEIVVFGLYGENVYRNVNVIRAFYAPSTNFPFSKPRFVLEGDELGIVNVPCLPPREVLGALREPGGWEHLPMEHFYIEGELRLWQQSRLLRLLGDRFPLSSPQRKRRAACWKEDSEALRLAVRIVQRFHDEVQAAGSRFLIVHLLERGDLSRARAGRSLPHAALLAELDRRGITIVDPTRKLLELAELEGLSELFLPHYTQSANRVIAEVLARNF